MDLVRVFMNLRPGSEFENKEMDKRSLDTIAKTWIDDGRGMPTQKECDDEWLKIQTEDMPKDIIRYKILEKSDVLLGAFVEMFEILNDKGVLSASDFSTEVRDKMQEIISLRSQL